MILLVLDRGRHRGGGGRQGWRRSLHLNSGRNVAEAQLDFEIEHLLDFQA